jgi:hypothetical protein
LASVFAAHNPPNPAPTMTTRDGAVCEGETAEMAPIITGQVPREAGDIVFGARVAAREGDKIARKRPTSA